MVSSARERQLNDSDRMFLRYYKRQNVYFFSPFDLFWSWLDCFFLSRLSRVNNSNAGGVPRPWWSTKHSQQDHFLIVLWPSFRWLPGGYTSAACPLCDYPLTLLSKKKMPSTKVLGVLMVCLWILSKFQAFAFALLFANRLNYSPIE
jgi:hypothetical protein